jgi:antitoxin component of MazEF toxin-antitoxin module
MELATVSRWGNSSAVRIPKQYLTDLGIMDNDKVRISKRGQVITIEKSGESKSLRQLIEERTGMDFEAYLQNNPYDLETDYVETGMRGREEI